MRSEFLFKFLDGIRPVDRLGRLVVVGNEIEDGLLQLVSAEKMVRVQEFALQDTKPDLNLIQPRGVGGQPIHLNGQAARVHRALLLKPVRQLLRCVRRAIIQDQDQRLHLSPQRFWKDDLFQERAEIHKAFARRALTIDLSIGDRECSHQVPCSPSDVARRLLHRRPWDGRTGSLFGLSCLKRRFLITADQPDPFPQQHSRSLIEAQHGARPLQKLLWVLDMLPRVIAPRSDALRFEPAANGAGRDMGQLGCTRHMTSQFASAPASQRNPLALRHAASHSGLSICAPVDRCSQRSAQLVDYSTLDDRGRRVLCAHGSPGSARWYALGRDGGVVLPLPQSIQSDGLAWGLSWSLSSQAESTSLSVSRQSRNDFMIVCTKHPVILV